MKYAEHQRAEARVKRHLTFALMMFETRAYQMAVFYTARALMEMTVFVPMERVLDVVKAHIQEK